MAFVSIAVSFPWNGTVACSLFLCLAGDSCPAAAGALVDSAAGAVTGATTMAAAKKPRAVIFSIVLFIGFYG